MTLHFNKMLPKMFVFLAILLPLALASPTSLNPYESGCLYSRGVAGKKRVCNSEDPEDAAERGICRPPPFDTYTEVRIFSENWESSIFGAWLLQMVLSELLDVPATIETGTIEANANFYDPKSRFQLGTSNDLLALWNFIELKDCRNANHDSAEEYQSCAHVVTEVWDTDTPWVIDHVYRGVVEAPAPLGVFADESWFIPKFTAERDPSLLSYFGLMGEDNRRKLAETFLTPTKWGDYCEQVSLNNCSTPDNVAQRYPAEEGESDRFFMEDLYTGHFRQMPKNNCDLFPNNCTGEIVDYPCGWSSYTEAQTYHLGIALKGSGDEPYSGGYSYGHMIELWKAANATKSNLIMMWWSPEIMYQQFQGTDAEFIRVSLPTASLECLENRIFPGNRCSPEIEKRVGNPLGICGDPLRPLKKLVARGLYDTVYSPQVPEALRSPAHEAVSTFTVTDLQLDQIFSNLETAASPREAVCEFAATTWAGSSLLRSNIPLTYPRVIKEDEPNMPLVYGSTILAGTAVLLVMCAAAMVYNDRKKRVMVYAQVEFLFLLLLGSVAVGLGALVKGLPSSPGSCVTQVWLINIGYALELVPLIIKVAAINKLMTAASRLRRVTTSRRSLFGAVAFVMFCIILFLVMWTIIDHPRKIAEYELSDIPPRELAPEEDVDVSESLESWLAEVEVRKFFYCDSESNVWMIVSVGWNLVLLLCASVLAFQTRNVRSQFNESRSLAMLIYSHFVFVLLRTTVYFFLPSINRATLEKYESLVLSCDTIALIVIYFFPKFSKPNRATSSDQSSHLIGPTSASQIFNSTTVSALRSFNPIRMIANISAISAFSGASLSDDDSTSVSEEPHQSRDEISLEEERLSSSIENPGSGATVPDVSTESEGPPSSSVPSQGTNKNVTFGHMEEGGQCSAQGAPLFRCRACGHTSYEASEKPAREEQSEESTGNEQQPEKKHPE